MAEMYSHCSGRCDFETVESARGAPRQGGSGATLAESPSQDVPTVADKMTKVGQAEPDPITLYPVAPMQEPVPQVEQIVTTVEVEPSRIMMMESYTSGRGAYKARAATTTTTVVSSGSSLEATAVVKSEKDVAGKGELIS